MKPVDYLKVREISQYLVLLSIVPLTGCGSSDENLKPVNGTVKYQGQQLAGATVTFLPIEDTPGFGGSGKTDVDGKFNIIYARGGDGLLPGKYKVTVSKRVMPDGSAPPDDVDPIESPARETLPPHYSNEATTRITKTVAQEGGLADIDLK